MEEMNVQQPAATTQPEGNGTPAEGKIFTQEEVNQIVRERLARERLKTGADAHEDILKLANQRLIEAELKGLQGYDCKLLSRLIDLSSVQVDSEGNINGLEAAVKAVEDEFPSVKISPATVQTVSFGVSNEGGSMRQSEDQRIREVMKLP